MLKINVPGVNVETHNHSIVLIVKKTLIMNKKVVQVSTKFVF